MLAGGVAAHTVFLVGNLMPDLHHAAPSHAASATRSRVTAASTRPTDRLLDLAVAPFRDLTRTPLVAAR